MNDSVRVIKLGGSLLSDPQLVAHLRRWLTQDRASGGAQAQSSLIWIIGGGLLADAIRQWDHLHQLGERPCHEFCLQLMSTTARIGQQLLAAALSVPQEPPHHQEPLHPREFPQAVAIPQAEAIPRLASWHSLRSWLGEPKPNTRMAVFDVGRVLLEDPVAEQAADLAATWHLTSDSLAAWVATRIEATELTLLKSCSPPDPPTRAAAVRAGIVDESFAVQSAALRRVAFVQLASSTTTWLDCD